MSSFSKNDTEKNLSNYQSTSVLFPFLNSQLNSTSNTASESFVFKEPIQTIKPIQFTNVDLDKLTQRFNSLSTGLDSSQPDSDPNLRPKKQLKRLLKSSQPDLAQLDIIQPDLPSTLSIHHLPPTVIDPVQSESCSIQSSSLSLTQEESSNCFEFEESDKDTRLASIFYNYPFTDWYQLTQLNLSRQSIKRLNRLDHYFPLLEHLHISHNSIKELSSLPKTLLSLYASDNKLSDVDIYNLDRLQHLDVSRNHIKSFESLKGLKSLRVLDASHNLIDSFKYFLDLPGLMKLSLKSNSIRQMKHFEMIPPDNQLETLDISYNKIETINCIENLKELRTLNADHNDIKHIQLIQPMEKLYKIQLSFNRLKSLDLSFFPEIRILYLDDNTIQRIIGMACTPRIESLSLRDQGGSIITFNLQYLRGIRKLYLSGSPFDKSINQFIDFYSIEYLELCSSNIENIPLEFSKHLPNLATLYLTSNRISDIRPLRKLKYLKRLVLIDNRLISVNEMISVVKCLKQLIYLDLRQNPITINIYPIVQLNNRNNKVSPYVNSALDEFWKSKDEEFCSTLPHEWLSRRSVYRALVTQECPKLIELDHIEISSQDRSDNKLIIGSFVRSKDSVYS